MLPLFVRIESSRLKLAQSVADYVYDSPLFSSDLSQKIVRMRAALVPQYMMRAATYLHIVG